MGFQAFSDLLKTFYALSGGASDKIWFVTISIYVYINYLNSFLVDRRVKAGASPGSGPGKLAIKKPSALKASLPYTVILLVVDILSSSLGVIIICRGFFWQVAIFFGVD